MIAVWLAQRQRTFGRAGQRNCKPNQSENTKLPFAHATVKASPLRFDPLTRRLAPTIDSRSASGPGPPRPKRRTLPFWRHPCDDAANFRQFTEFIGGKRLQDTSRLSGTKCLQLRQMAVLAILRLSSRTSFDLGRQDSKSTARPGREFR